jgi:hypothetical protein
LEPLLRLQEGSNSTAPLRVKVTLRLAIYRQLVRLHAKSLRFTTRHYFFQMNPRGHSPYVTSSLTRGWARRLQLLLVLASAVIFVSESRWTRVSASRPPTWMGRSPYLYPPGTGWPSYTPRALGSLFVASYNSRGYGGGIRAHLHTAICYHSTRSQSQSYFTTGGLPPISSSWRQAP